MRSLFTQLLTSAQRTQESQPSDTWEALDLAVCKAQQGGAEFDVTSMTSAVLASQITHPN